MINKETLAYINNLNPEEFMSTKELQKHLKKKEIFNLIIDILKKIIIVLSIIILIITLILWILLKIN